MLVQFSFKNVLSFRDETVLDMTAINAYKEHPCNLINNENNVKLLRVAAIYGANASGKSNLTSAMYYFQRIIRESFNNNNDKNETILKRFYKPYSLEQNHENSEFEIINIIGDFQYRYGFEYNDKCIVAEWLYKKSLTTNRQSTIFERTTDYLNLGSMVRKECSLYQEQIPVETLVLSFFNKLKLKTSIFNTVYSAIMDTLIVPVQFSDSPKLIETFLPMTIDKDKSALLSFLSAIDSGIKDINYMTDESGKIRFETTHVDREGKSHPLNLYNESAGTIKAIMLFVYAQTAIVNNSSVFIDELNMKLHPLLLKFTVDLFYKNSNSQAQLLYTTHDTTLLDKKFFRRDQIWFVQKDNYGHSELLSLAEFKIRPDASFGKDYLAGVYGGIPNLKDFCFEEGEKNGD